MSASSDGSWSLWEVGISIISSGALTASIVFIFWFGGKTKEVESLRKEFDEHKKGDADQFTKVNDRMDKISDKIGTLATRDDVNQLSASFQSSLSQMGAGMQ